MLRHPPVGDRDLLGTDRVGDPAHLARVVAEPIVDVIEPDDLRLAPPPRFAVASEFNGAKSPGGSGPGRIGLYRQQPAKRDRLILVACILGSVIVFVDSTVVNVALPAIEDDLGGGLALQQWVVNASCYARLAAPRGWSLGDLFGARRLFLIGIVTFGLTSILCAAAPDGTTLIFARGLQGVAGALLTPAGLAVIASTFQGEERGAAIGEWTAWTGIAFEIWPLVGGWLVTHASWRWVFIINVPFAVATAALVLYAVPKAGTRERGARPRLGGILCAAGLAGPVFALIEAPQRGFGDPVILVALFGGILLLAAFVLWERRAPQPMLPARLFRQRNFSFANLDTSTVYAGLGTPTFFLFLYLQQIAGYSALRSGLALVPITVVMFVLSSRFGRLSMRFGPRLFMVVWAADRRGGRR